MNWETEISIVELQYNNLIIRKNTKFICLITILTELKMLSWHNGTVFKCVVVTLNNKDILLKYQQPDRGFIYLTKKIYIIIHLTKKNVIERRFALTPEPRNENINLYKYFISSSRDRTHN